MKLHEELLEAAYTRLLSSITKELLDLLLDKKPMIFIPGHDLDVNLKTEYTRDSGLKITIEVKPEILPE